MRRYQPQKGVLFGFKREKYPIFDVYSYNLFYIFLTFELLLHHILKKDGIGRPNIVLINSSLFPTRSYA